jgi:hypothetical protein
MSILYVGDLHGNLDATARLDAFAIARGCEAVVQVGDFGLRWKPDPLGKFFDKRGRQARKQRATRKSVPWFTCGGNHEYWPIWKELEAASDPGDPLVELAPDVFYVKRGRVFVIDGLRHGFLGGAESSDRHSRTEGKNWWPEESPSRAELELFFENVDDVHLDVVVTHDAPLETGTFRHEDRAEQPTCRGLSRVVELAARRPRVWMFGHHHNHGTVDRQDVRGGVQVMTSYFGCGLEGQGWLLQPTGWGLPAGLPIEKIDVCPDAPRRENRRWI